MTALAALIALLPEWLDPATIIERGGLWLVALIVFAESGLLVGFFLPGDSLLFVTGFLATKPQGLPHVGQPLPVVLAVLAIAAIVGDQIGFVFGRRVGPALFDRPRSRLFDPRNVARSEQFFQRHGAKTIVLARFVPIVRTFAPIVAGVSRMPYRSFVTFNVVGGALWAVGVTTLGYYLGQIDLIRDHVELAALVVVAMSLVPIAVEFVKHRRALTAGPTDHS